ncbi:MAG: S49 family peptidase, partial [Burkholderiaceae bacterium]|nr:S49 family peptidase [Burkholderiaceae bacterium]
MSESKSPSETHLEQSVALLNYLVTEQKRARRRTLIRYGMIALFVLAYGIFLAALATRNSTPSAPDQGYVSLVRLEGEIGPGKAISAEKVNPLLTKAFEDEKAKGVILVMNSPGGSPVQSSLIFDHLQ